MWPGPLSPFRCRILRQTSQFEYCLKNQLQVQCMGMTGSLSNDRVRGTRFFGFVEKYYISRNKRQDFLKSGSIWAFSLIWKVSLAGAIQTLTFIQKIDCFSKPSPHAFPPCLSKRVEVGAGNHTIMWRNALHLLLRKCLMNFCSSMNIPHRWMDWSWKWTNLNVHAGIS